MKNIFQLVVLVLAVFGGFFSYGAEILADDTPRGKDGDEIQLVIPVKKVSTNSIPLVEKGFVGEFQSEGDWCALGLYWPKTKIHLHVAFLKGNVTEMKAVAWDSEEDKTFHFEAGKDSSVEFAPWINFAMRTKERFSKIGTGLYVDSKPFQCVGISSVTEHYETPSSLESVMLSREGVIIAIPSLRWRGDLPKEGDEVLLGRTDSFEGLFFRVVGQGGKFFVEPDVVGSLATKEGRALPE